MRYISSQTERAVRFIGLSTALANAGFVIYICINIIAIFEFLDILASYVGS